MISSSPNYDPQGQLNSSLRLIFMYRGAQIYLTSEERVEMMPPPSDPVDKYEGQSGFWVELRDGQEHVLYRRIMHNPIQLEHEALSGDLEHPFTHVKTETDEGTFMVIVPDVEQARILTLHGSPSDDAASPAKELIRVDLKQQRPRPGKEGAE